MIGHNYIYKLVGLQKIMDIFDRNMFNRLYFEWFCAVYEREPDVAIEADKQVIPRLGKKMAQKIKEQMRGDANSIEYLLDALKQSHWFQEEIEIIERTKERAENYAILQAKCCSFQIHWIEKFGEPLYCITSHGNFLKEFCREINPNSKIENLIAPEKNPKDDVYCKWRISI